MNGRERENKNEWKREKEIEEVKGIKVSSIVSMRREGKEQEEEKMK